MYYSVQQLPERYLNKQGISIKEITKREKRNELWNALINPSDMSVVSVCKGYEWRNPRKWIPVDEAPSEVRDFLYFGEGENKVDWNWIKQNTGTNYNIRGMTCVLYFRVCVERDVKPAKHGVELTQYVEGYDAEYSTSLWFPFDDEVLVEAVEYLDELIYF